MTRLKPQAFVATRLGRRRDSLISYVFAGLRECLVLVAFLTFLLATPQLAAAEPKYPELGGMRVVDTANVIPPAVKADLETKLADLETKTSAQLVVVTVPDLQGYSIEEFGIGLLRSWKIGQKTINNGAIILVAKAERKVRIEVGYGLEGALTDATSKIIITNAMVPPLRTGDYGLAFTRAVADISSVITGEAKDQGWKGVTRDTRDNGGSFDWTQVALILLFIIVLLWLSSNTRRGSSIRRGSGFPGVIVLPGGGFSGGSFSGGGGFSGGGFSGGGGDGGGGGASGDF